jgi:hypothetical protein
VTSKTRQLLACLDMGVTRRRDFPTRRLDGADALLQLAHSVAHAHVIATVIVKRFTNTSW